MTEKSHRDFFTEKITKIFAGKTGWLYQEKVNEKSHQDFYREKPLRFFTEKNDRDFDREKSPRVLTEKNNREKSQIFSLGKFDGFTKKK